MIKLTLNIKTLQQATLDTIYQSAFVRCYVNNRREPEKAFKAVITAIENEEDRRERKKNK